MPATAPSSHRLAAESPASRRHGFAFQSLLHVPVLSVASEAGFQALGHAQLDDCEHAPARVRARSH
jgi:hypothetical protein